tara:strand:+ start:3858 stop:4091 length:234 start_codon:yes stop_codon:yes gene_type:complete
MDAESKSLEFMGDPNKWPRWPQLPLVNRNTRQAGFLVEGSTKVYLANIYDTVHGLSDIESISYDSFEEVVTAGWEVD